MHYQPSITDRIAAALMGLRAAYAITFIVAVTLALAGILDLRSLDPELARFFAMQPAPLYALWVVYVSCYMIAAILLWTGRPTRALMTYMGAFALDIVLWTLVYTAGVDQGALPAWGRIMDVVITTFDLIAISYMLFVVMVFRKPAGEGFFSPR